MWRYYLFLGWRSLWKTPVMTLLMMLALGFGMSFTLVLLTLEQAGSKNPMEHKIDRIFSVQTDNWSENPAEIFFQSRNFMPTAINFRDTKFILNSGIPTRTTMLSASGAILENPDNDDVLPAMHSGYLVTRDFFSMFDVPFKHGGAWEEQGQYNGIHKIILGDWANQIFFNGKNSVGKILLVDGTPYTVTGLIEDNWYMAPRIYDPTNTPMGTSPGFFFPLEDIALHDYHRWGGFYTWKHNQILKSHEDFLNSETLWVRPWVEFDSSEQKEDFENYLKGYIESEQENGRYLRTNKIALSNSSEWMKIVAGFQGLAEVALTGLILLICTTNSIALLMAKFLRTTADAAVRRALGASKSSVFIQHLFEALLIALGGGLFALILAYYWFEVLKRMMSGYDYYYFADFAHLNLFSLLLIFTLVLISTLLSGAIPAWRVSRAQPGRYLNAE
ncbi:ABC transporter permease [Teredinibacter franksiae]|uniref:ABC transporter permease n=1 Tax=Teredinibacter franksiae TaxID=2761453 RepID=UPI001627A03E|nr:FtsX-like permease family protein [Teredinibacter franksiae]